MRPFRRLVRPERGQVLIALALMAPVLLAMAGMAIDIGSYADDKRNLQNAADAIALAAAQRLCTPDPADCSNATNATATAQSYATKNNINWADVTLAFDNLAVTPTGNPTARVAIARNHAFAFMRIVGINSKGVGVKAGAIKTSPGGMSGLTPFGVTTLPAPGTVVDLKFDSGGGCQSLASGNCGAMQFDKSQGGCTGSGAALYECTIEQGATSIVCAQPASGCRTTSNICASYDTCPPQTGNIVGATRTGINFLLNNTSTNCDSFGEAFSGAGPVYTMNPTCNPWQGPGACTRPVNFSNPQQCSRRVIIIPVVDGFPNGNSNQATILSFALFWLNGFANGGCTGGNSCTVQATYVKSDVTVNALAGVYDAKASIHFTKLTE